MFKNYIFYIFIIFSFSYSYSQSIQDLQKLKNEYEKYKTQQDQATPIDPALVDIDPATGLPKKGEIYPYVPLKFSLTDSLSRESKHFGYSFFTKRDTVSFWESLPTPTNYLLGPGDELIVSLWGETQLRESYIINRDGKIYDEKVGLLNLSGKTINEALLYLKSQYGRIYSTLNGKPQSTFIDVSLGKLQSINVNFVGQVKYPGVYPIHPFSTVITGLIQAGGIDTTGSLRKIQLKRNGRIETNIDLYGYLINGDLAANIQLRDQDIVVVPPRKSIIMIDSAVVNDGIYEAISGETVYDLIQNAGGTKNGASDIVGIRSIKARNDRQNGINFEAYYKNIDETKQILADNVEQISVRYLFDELQNVELIGQVKVPGRYHYYDGMTFNELIRLGGGFEDSTFWKSVYHEQAEIIRRSPNNRYDKVISINLKNLYYGNNDLKLQNLDRVVIHANSNFFEKPPVQIVGEVNVPGSYPLIADNETLRSLLERAGSFTSKALKNGISIYRNKKYFEMSTSQVATFANAESFEGGEILGGTIGSKDIKTTKQSNKVRVAWKNLSVTLMPGDSIVVKESPGTVNISGQVYNPGLIEYRKGEKIKYYINGAGGITNDGNKRSIIVVYANGVVSPYRWYSIPKIEDGASIIVNKKPPSEPFDPTTFASTTLSLLSSFVTILVLSKQI